MNYYQEISLQPTVEISIYFLWQKLYQQIHLALVANKNADNTSVVGICFPEYDADKYYLGKKLRVFAQDKKILEDLNCEQWLNRLSDYVHINKISQIPAQLDGYACFKHIKPKGNKEKLARRRAKRKGETLQQALAHFDRFEQQHSDLPYINMQSQTNDQRFRLFIEKKIVDVPQIGSYSCYGLSNTTTVPLF